VTAGKLAELSTERDASRRVKLQVRLLYSHMMGIFVVERQ
jgi:hypothetical protein